MLRVVVMEIGCDPLPPLDIDDSRFVIGSDPTARVRLPPAHASPQHLVVDNTDNPVGPIVRTPDEFRSIGTGIAIDVGNFRVKIMPAPVGAVATPPQRTESLARELMRGLLGADGAPTLVVERGALAGAKRALAPPESALVIGRGDEAHWPIDDRDLSKRHVEIRRGWDGVRAVDLDSKNGTRIDGVAIREAELRDGALLELGNLALRYRDPAERHLRASAAPAPVVAAAAPARRRNPIVFYVALAIALVALAGIAWLLAA